MGRMVLNLLFFFGASSIIAYGCYLMGYGVIAANASGAYRPIIVRDALRANDHHLSGLVMVENTCDELTLSTQTLSTTSYELSFGTWREPSVRCEEVSTPRSFQALVYAPAVGVNFQATYNGRSLPIAVITLAPEQ